MANQKIEHEFVSDILDGKLAIEQVIRSEFDGNWLQYNGEIWDWLLNYWQTHNKLPTIDLTETRYPIYQYKESDLPPTELLDALRKNSEMDRFIGDLDRVNTILRKTGNVENATDYLQVQLSKYDNNSVQDVFDLSTDIDMDKLYQLYKLRYNLMQTQGFVGIPTGFGIELDTWLNGGSMKGNLYGMLAPLGVGKTWSMMLLGAAAIENGKTPFMLTLEGNLEKEGYRATTSVTGISNSALHTASIQDDDVFRAMEFFKKKVRGKNAHYYLAVHGNRNVYTPTVLHQKLVKHKADILIVDYLSLMGLKTGDTLIDEWKVVSHISGQLKKMAVIFDMPVWAVLQGNRGSNNKEELTAEDSSYYNALRDFDAVTGLSKIKGRDYTIRLNGVKGRDSKESFSAYYTTNWDNGKVEFQGYADENEHF